MTKEFERLRGGIENVLFVYINTYVAIDKWIEYTRANPELVTKFEDAEGVEHFPPLIASEIIAAQDYIYGSALIHAVMQFSRIVELYLGDLTKAVMTVQPVDDTWFSLDAVSFLTAVPLSEVYKYGAIMRLDLLRGAVDRVGVVSLSQPQVMALAKEIISFAEDFDSRYELQKLVKDKTKNGKQQKLLNPATPGPDGPGNLGAVRGDEPRTIGGTESGPKGWTRKGGDEYWPFPMPREQFDVPRDFTMPDPPDNGEYGDPDEDDLRNED